MNSDTARCPECGTTGLWCNKEQGEIICRDCGLVIDDKLIKVEIPTKQEDGVCPGLRDGVGPTMTYRLADQGLFTKIGDKSEINKLPSKERYLMRRLSRWQRRTVSAIERNLDIALNFMKNYVSALKLPGVIEDEAARIYTFAVQQGYSRGRCIEHSVAASIYIATRNQEFPVALSDIAEISDIPKKELGRAVRALARSSKIRIKPQDPVDYISKICGRLTLNAAIQTKAAHLLDKTRSKNPHYLSGKAPFGIAAAAVYLSALILNEKRTQADVAKAANITEVTLRNRFHSMLNILDLKFKSIRSYKNRKLELQAL